MTDKTNEVNANPEDMLAEEEMFVSLDFDDNTTVDCSVATILTVRDKEYIALLPLEKDGINNTGEVWFYSYSENKDDPNEEPVLGEITDDEIYDEICDAYDEFVDKTNFDQLNKLTTDGFQE